jgi:hypothetical protein
MMPDADERDFWHEHELATAFYEAGYDAHFHEAELDLEDTPTDPADEPAPLDEGYGADDEDEEAR